MRLAKSPLAFRKQLQWLQLGLLCLFVAVGLAYYRVQILNHDHYEALGEKSRIKKRVVKASRGLIYDRHERLITRNLPAYDLVLMRDEMKDRWDDLKPKVSAFLNVPEDELHADYQRFRATLMSLPITIDKDIRFPSVVRVLRNRTQYPGLNVNTSSRRDYVYPDLFSHVLGYVGEATESEIERDPRVGLGDIVGKRGLEKSYDAFLTGVDGTRTVQMNSRGFFFSDNVTLDPIPGGNIIVTLDFELQKIAAEALGSFNGAVLLMDAQSGELLVFVSAPSFDINRFTRRMSDEEWQALVNQPNQPLFNRPIQGLYAPGSIFKVATALAALESQMVTPETTFFCTGAFEYYGRVFKCNAGRGHGELDLRGAVQKSCNVYFYQVADRIGANQIASMAQRLGFGKPTGVDLIGEKKGLVPTPKWKKERFNKIWYPGETLSVSIGQGDLQVTPIQLVNMMAIVANMGHGPVPRLVHKLERGSESRYVQTQIQHVDLPESYFRVVRDGMWAAVNLDQGTGSSAAIKGRDVCGKTGTAQLITFRNDSDRKDTRLMNAWFAGFAPKNNPEVVVVVLVEHAGGGGVNAAPIAREILEAYFSSHDRIDPI